MESGQRDPSANPTYGDGPGEEGAAVRSSAAGARTGARAHRRNRFPVAPLVAALVVGLVAGGLAVAAFGPSRADGDPFSGMIDEDGYQAVILANDKVYFGRIEDVGGGFFRLEDAFFLRERRESDDAAPVRALLPVSRELHAPENRMLIRKDHVVLVENLTDDSPVLEEIRRQKRGD